MMAARYSTRPASIWTQGGESHPHAKLSDHEVEMVRQLREGGMSWSLLSDKFEISQRALRDICSYRRRAC